MSDDRRRARALPIFGGGRNRDREIDPRQDENNAASVFKLLFRGWPFIYRYIAGRWIVLAIGAGKAKRPPADNEGFFYAPLLLTLLAYLGAVHGALAIDSDAPGAAFWGVVGQGLLAALAVCAWGAWALAGRAQVAAALIGVLCASLANFLYWAALKTEGRFLAFNMSAVFIAGYFIRIYFDKGLRIALRVSSHVIYYNAISSLSRFVTTAALALGTGLLVQNIFIGAPLTGPMAALLGHPEMAQGRVEMLSAAQREALLVNYVAISVFFYAFTRIVFFAILPYYSIWVLQKINQDLRLALVERWHRLSLRFHADQRVGDSVYRIYQDSAQVTSVISRFVTFATNAIGIATAIFLLFFFDWRLAATAAAIMAPMVMWAAWFSPRMRARALSARETNSDLTSRIQEVLTGLKVIKAYGREDFEQERFETDSVTAFNAAYRARSLVALATIGAFTCVAFFLLGGEFAMAIWSNQSKAVAATALMAMIGVTFTMWNASTFTWVRGNFFTAATDARLFSREWTLAQDTAMGLGRVFDILDIDPDVKDAPHATPMPAFEREIAFDDVAFSYSADRPILTGVSFKAKPGTITAIVGPTGAGKSTMMALMLRLFDPERGAVAVDGRDLRDLQVESVRDNISIALQENILFGMSVADNIRYVRPKASLEEVTAASRVACADEFIRELPEGYDTMLGDRGGRLSAGQRQRLSIARALIKNAPILILDEPTAALDAATEHEVMRNLHEWGRDRAIFIITHRLSTIRQADQILFLHEGRVQEAGHHDDLMRSHGRYRDMVNAELAVAHSGRPEAVS